MCCTLSLTLFQGLRESESSVCVIEVSVHEIEMSVRVIEVSVRVIEVSVRVIELSVCTDSHNTALRRSMILKPSHRFKIEDEIGRIVRTDTFNLTKRKNDANHHTKMQFSSRELYVLKFAGGRPYPVEGIRTDAGPRRCCAVWGDGT